MKSKYCLGNKAGDKITGYTGTIIAICFHLDGTSECKIQSEGMSSGVPVSPQWFAEIRLAVNPDDKIGFKS